MTERVGRMEETKMSRGTFSLKVAENVAAIALVVGCGKADLDRTLTTLGPLMPTVAMATSTTSGLIVMWRD